MLRHVDAGVLDVAFEESGSSRGPAVLLLHGFPYDIHAYDEVGPLLAAARLPGHRAVSPRLWPHAISLRGHAALRPAGSRSATISCRSWTRSESRAPVLAGYDWGGRAACVVSALWPERARGLVSVLRLQHPAHRRLAARRNRPSRSIAYWYQYYFHSERGRAGLAENRHDLGKLLWRLWSPNWRFDDATYDRTAGAFDNPDFVDVVIQSYRHRFGLAPGDPAVEDTERRLSMRPRITVPTIVLHGEGDGVSPVATSEPHRRFFTGAYERRLIPVVGHNLPQEAPREFAEAILTLVRGSSGK